MRYLCLALCTAFLSQRAVAQAGKYDKVSLRVTSCPLADSVQGPYQGKARKVTALRRPDSPTLLVEVGSDQVNQGLSSPHVSISLRASPAPVGVLPDAYLSFLIPGDAGRRLLAANEAPSLTLELSDSVVLRPAKVTLGTYDGPRSFAVAPLSTQLAPNSLLAVIRSDSLVIRAGLTWARPSPSFRDRLRDAYRLTVCGYDSSD